MTEDIKNYVKKLYDTLHEMPEKGFEEFKTAKFIADELKSFGYEVIENIGGQTGVIGILDSKVEGPVLGLRADMDALEYVIDGKKEMRHTCGHDAHSAMLLAAAKKIAEQGIKKGKIMFIFQPAEEKLTGSLSILDTGILDDLDELVGIHVRPVDDTSLGNASPAVWHSATKLMTLKIYGNSAHGARPHLGINVVDVAHSVVGAINSIRVNPSVPHSVKVTNLTIGGNTYNLIPDEGFMALDIRCERNDVMDEMIEKIKKVLQGVTEAYGARYEITYLEGVPAAEYDQEMIAVADEAIKEVLGEDGSIGELYNPGGEDFHFITQRVKCKSTYIGLGADAYPGLHHRDMQLNKDALPYGVEILTKVVEKRLG